MNKDLQIAKKAVETEIKGLKKLLKSFNNSSQFSKAVNLISKVKGKVVVSSANNAIKTLLRLQCTGKY